MHISAKGFYERLFLRYEEADEVKVLSYQLCKSLIYFINPWLVKVQNNSVLDIYNIHFPNIKFHFALNHNEGMPSSS